MDIRAGAPYPAGKLSNFPRQEFVLDGVKISSREGFLQSLKFRDLEDQELVCSLVGMEAKTIGKTMDWRKKQTLYWRGIAIDRHSVEYQILLDRAFEEAVRQCPEFRDALIATGDEPLTHMIGNKDPKETILTESELISRLLYLRDKLHRGEL